MKSLSIKKLLILAGGFFIYMAGFLPEQAVAQDTANEARQSRKIKSILFDIQFIINNESFTLQKTFFGGFKNAIRYCVFESPSAVWTIEYCHKGEIEIEGPWHLLLAGEFSIKDEDKQLFYYLERESNIYRNIEHGSLAFGDYLRVYFLRVYLMDKGFRMNVGYSQKRLPFLQNLARVQEQYIQKSLTEEPQEEVLDE